MKPKLILCLALALSGGLFVCHIAWQQHVQSFLGRLRPPSADQVKKWAGFPENTHLTMLTNVPDHIWYGDDDIHLGKFKWFWAYEDRKGSNFTCLVIAVYEPGALWPTNRAKFMHSLKQSYKEIQKVQAKEEKLPGVVAKEGVNMAQEILPITMPNGQKSYGFLFGLSPARFAFHPEFDVLAYEDAEPDSYDDRYPPADLTATATNSFSEFFTNVDAFITSQK
jgi:hypothetical protein